MATFTVKVILDIPDENLHREVEQDVFVPPDYGPVEKVQLYAISLENAAQDLLKREGWRQPLRHALAANDARALRIEELAGSQQTVPSAAIIAVLETGSQDAIDQWGQDPID
jgi:hypothetical protein